MDELFIGGELQETSKKEVLRICAQQEEMMEDGQSENSSSRPRTSSGRN